MWLPLPRGAAALGALAFERVLRRDPAQLTLVQRLPVPLAHADGGRRRVQSARVAAGDRPTHVVHRGRAWPLAGTPLHVGASVPAAGARSLPVAAGPGVSRTALPARSRTATARGS